MTVNIPEDFQPLKKLSFRELFTEIKNQFSLLLKKEIALARTEITAEVKTEASMAKGVLIATVSGILGGISLLVSLILALSLVLPGWAAGLIVSVLFLTIALITFSLSWKKRIRSPLVRTKEVINSDIKIVKEKLA